MNRALIPALFSKALLRQVSSGSLHGQVQDPSGASVAGARLSVTQEEAGFRNAVGSHLPLEINQTSRLDVHLEIGIAHDTVTVVAATPPLQTDDNSEGYFFGSVWLPPFR